MIHPSYVELMKVVNNDTEIGEEPVVNSRYSIVIAASKRARQLIDGSEPLVGGSYRKKPLSVSVDELYKGKVKILGEEDPEEENAGSEEEAMEALPESGEPEAIEDAPEYE